MNLNFPEIFIFLNSEFMNFESNQNPMGAYQKNRTKHSFPSLVVDQERTSGQLLHPDTRKAKIIKKRLQK